MLLIPFNVGHSHYSIFVILEPENLARMKDNDPAQVNIWKMPEAFRKLQLRDVILATPTAADASKALGLIRGGKPAAAIEFLSRGFKFKPGEGDSDLPYQTGFKEH